MKNSTEKYLLYALISSGLLNVCLLTSVVYLTTRSFSPVQFKHHPMLLLEEREKLGGNNLSQLFYFSTLSIKELLPFLEDCESVEDGYLRRDLALSVLVSMHDFDIQTALSQSKNNLQIRYLELTSSDGKESFEIQLFPGLIESQFSRLQKFLLTEKWPYTELGLFKRIEEGQRDKDLLEAFYYTESFQAVKRLFGRANYALGDEELLGLILEGGYSLLERFALSQKYVEDLSDLKRQTFLLDTLMHNSTAAAEILLCFEQEYVLKKCLDSQILKLLTLVSLGEENQGLERFLALLEDSPRSDDVIFAVKEKKSILYENEDEIAERIYIVKEGDSLWKIAKEQGISLDDLLLVNHLDKSNYIFPGYKLVLP